MRVVIFAFLILTSLLARAQDNNNAVVVGKNFEILATQQITFVPLKDIDPQAYKDLKIPEVVNLKNIQSKVKNQGPRGACTYFVLSSLIESLIKKNLGKEVDISEEYIAWAAKVKMKLRADEEDSSVAVNAVTVQEFGFMFESDLPYQPSWFEKGQKCYGQKYSSKIDSICFSHSGPTSKQLTQVIDGKNFIFEAVNSSSVEVVKAIARLQTPVTASILGHPDTFANANETGELKLTSVQKDECTKKLKACSGHAVLIVGYDLKNKVFTFKNSWGAHWGEQGYGTISFDYIDQMSERKFMAARLVNPPQLKDRIKGKEL